MLPDVIIHVIARQALTPNQLFAAQRLCSEVYEEPLGPLEPWADEAVHVMAFLDGLLVSHALWVERILQPGGLPSLRTAYVEAVATLVAYQQRGIGTAVMQRLQSEIRGYDLAGLSENPDFRGWYQRLGWESWQGPLLIRMEMGVLPTPDDHCMVLRLPKTPQLDLTASLSAEWRTGELW